MQTRAFIPQDWTQPLPAERLVEWVKICSLLAGIGAIPLLVCWLAQWYWTVSLAAGLLVLGTGLFILSRSARQARARTRAEHSAGVLAETQLPGRAIQVTARRKQPTETGEGEFLAAGTGDLRQGSRLTLLGMLILLPAAAGPLLQLAEVPDAHRLTSFLGSPALLLWAAFEGLAGCAHWQQRGAGRAAILGLVHRAAQLLGALLVWVFLGLSYGTDQIDGLFWVGAGLALLSALAGMFTPSTSCRPGAPPEQPAPGANMTGSEPAAAPAERVQPVPETASGPDQAPPAESPGKVAAAASGAEAPLAAGRAVFQIFRGKDHQFYFRLRAGNGEIILSSEGYRTKHGCQKGIDSVRHNAPLSERYERRATRAGQFSFILKAANHQVIGTSEGYTTPAGRQAGIQAVMRAAPLAGVEEVEWKV